MLRPLAWTVLLTFAAAAPAAATTISFQNGFDGYASAENRSFSLDGIVSQGRIRVDLHTGSHPDERYAWVIFGGIVGPGAIPSGANIVSASFEGFVTNPFDSATITRLLDDIGNRPQGPGENVFDHAGSFYDDSQDSSASHGPCATTTLCSPPTPIAWDVTAIVQSWVDGAPNFGFLLLPETTNGGNLATNGDPDPSLRPRLVVVYDEGGISVPEPTTLALLGIGTLGAALRRRA